MFNGSKYYENNTKAYNLQFVKLDMDMNINNLVGVLPIPRITVVN